MLNERPLYGIDGWIPGSPHRPTDPPRPFAPASRAWWTKGSLAPCTIPSGLTGQSASSDLIEMA